MHSLLTAFVKEIREINKRKILFREKKIIISILIYKNTVYRILFFLVQPHLKIVQHLMTALMKLIIPK